MTPPSGGFGPVRIGITGPIGCGKSTVAGWLGELGAFVIDADTVARDVTLPGSDVLALVVNGVLQSMIGGLAGFYGGYLRRRFADPNLRAQQQARKRR